MQLRNCCESLEKQEKVQPMSDKVGKKVKKIIAEKEKNTNSRTNYLVFDHKPTLVDYLRHAKFNQMKGDILRAEFKPIMEYSELNPESDDFPETLRDFVLAQQSKLLMAAKLQNHYEQEPLRKLTDEYLLPTHKEYCPFYIHTTDTVTYMLLPFNLVDDLRKNIRTERRGGGGSVKSMAQH
jgi:hypothetical protein